MAKRQKEMQSSTNIKELTAFIKLVLYLWKEPSSFVFCEIWITVSSSFLYMGYYAVNMCVYQRIQTNFKLT